MMRHCIVHHIGEKKFYSINQLTLKEQVFKAQLRLLQSFFKVTGIYCRIFLTLKFKRRGICLFYLRSVIGSFRRIYEIIRLFEME